MTTPKGTSGTSPADKEHSAAKPTAVTAPSGQGSVAIVRAGADAHQTRDLIQAYAGRGFRIFIVLEPHERPKPSHDGLLMPELPEVQIGYVMSSGSSSIAWLKTACLQMVMNHSITRLVLEDLVSALRWAGVPATVHADLMAAKPWTRPNPTQRWSLSGALDEQQARL